MKREEILPARFPEHFREARAAYPKRPGSNWREAAACWDTRIKQGHSPEAMVAGVRAYAAYCAAVGTTGNHVKMPQTFFGKQCHFACDWSVGEESTAATPDTAAGALLKYYAEEPLL